MTLLAYRLAGPPLLRGPPEQAHFRALLADAHRRAWFVAPGAESLAVSFRGTRPGAPLADAIFVFVIAELVAQVHGGLRELGMDLQLRPTDPRTLRQDTVMPPVLRTQPPGAASPPSPPPSQLLLLQNVALRPGLRLMTDGEGLAILPTRTVTLAAPGRRLEGSDDEDSSADAQPKETAGRGFSQLQTSAATSQNAITMPSYEHQRLYEMRLSTNTPTVGFDETDYHQSSGSDIDEANSADKVNDISKTPRLIKGDGVE